MVTGRPLDLPVLDETSFVELLLARDDLARPDSPLRQSVDPLLAVAGPVHESDLFPASTWSDWSDEDLLALLDRLTAIEFRHALGFIPECHLRRLGAECHRNPGELMERSETLFVLHVARSGSPRAAEYVEHYAVALALWRSGVAEQERRWLHPDVSLRVLVMVAKHGVLGEPGARDEATRMLQRFYLSRARKVLRVAHAKHSLVATHVKTESGRREVHKEEATGDLSLLLAESLAGLAPDRGRLFRQALARDPAVTCLPTRITYDAINSVEKLLTQGRTTQSPVVFLDERARDDDEMGQPALDISIDDLATGADVPRPLEPGAHLGLNSLKTLVAQHLPARSARILCEAIDAALVDGEIPNYPEIGRRVGLTGRDPGRIVAKAIAQALAHPIIGPAITSLRSRSR